MSILDVQLFFYATRQTPILIADQSSVQINDPVTVVTQKVSAFTRRCTRDHCSCSRRCLWWLCRRCCRRLPFRGVGSGRLCRLLKIHRATYLFDQSSGKRQLNHEELLPPFSGPNVCESFKDSAFSQATVNCAELEDAAIRPWRSRGRVRIEVERSRCSGPRAATDLQPPFSEAIVREDVDHAGSSIILTIVRMSPTAPALLAFCTSHSQSEATCDEDSLDAPEVRSDSPPPPNHHDRAGSPPSMKALAAREDTRWHAGRRSQYESRPDPDA